MFWISQCCALRTHPVVIAIICYSILIIVSWACIVVGSDTTEYRLHFCFLSVDVELLLLRNIKYIFTQLTIVKLNALCFDMRRFDQYITIEPTTKTWVNIQLLLLVVIKLGAASMYRLLLLLVLGLITKWGVSFMSSTTMRSSS